MILGREFRSPYQLMQDVPYYALRWVILMVFINLKVLAELAKHYRDITRTVTDF